MTAGLLGACTPPAGTGDPTTTTTTVPPAHQIDQDNFPATAPTVSTDLADCVLNPVEPTHVQSAQTFTAGRSGQLDQVDLMISYRDPAAAPLSVSIQSTTPAGGPSGVELGSGLYSGPAAENPPAMIPLSSPATVVAGTKYAIVLAESACVSTAIGAAWRLQLGIAEYSAGGYWASQSVGAPNWIDYFAVFNGDFDIRFRTWVS